jgi:hypothetical protein
MPHTTSATLGVGLALMYAVKAARYLRVTAEGERQGLDLHEHGIPAYPEYALHPSATPQGAPDFAVAAYSSAPASSMAKAFTPSH